MLFLKGLEKNGQCSPAKSSVILGRVYKTGFRLEHGENLMSVMTAIPVTARSVLSGGANKTQSSESQWGRGGSVIQ